MNKFLVRGVSLLEALVAMGVMAFGILGVMGMQLTLRSNADMAKQRSQATRIAQEKMETWRSFAVLDTTSGYRAYADIATPAPETVTPEAGNTSYLVTGQVTETGHLSHKTLLVEVSWTDRNNEAQKVSLTSLVGKVHPELAASLAVKSSGTPTANPMGRHRSIPMNAHDFGDGHSGFRPPQATGGTVAWLFNNETGLIDLCSTAVAANADIRYRSDLTGCANVAVDGVAPPAYMLLSGYIRFATGTSQPNAYGVLFAFGPEFPVPELQVLQTAPLALGEASPRAVPCFHTAAGVGISDFSIYYCAIAVVRPDPLDRSGTRSKWSGSLQFLPFASTPTAHLATSLAESRNDHFKVCRFTAIGTYTDQRVGLRNENYALIRAGDNTTAFICPTGVSWHHQPTS